MQIKINERLKELRRQCGHTQKQVAYLIQVKTSTYQAYEEGRAQPPRGILIALTSIYKFSSIDEFIGSKADHRTSLEKRYAGLSMEKRKIVDFILDG